MWDCGRPNPALRGAGFPVLDDVRHSLIFAGERQAGAYNHHSKLTRHRGMFHAMWSNHPHGEDGPGQRVLYSHSSDGVRWSSSVELFPPMQPPRPNGENGLVLTAWRWVKYEGRLFATAMCNENIGFENPDGSEIVPQRDAGHRFLARRFFDGFCREIGENGPICPPILPMGDKVPPPAPAFVSLYSDDEEAMRLGRRVREEMCRPENTPSWNPPGISLPRGVDTLRLCEPTVYRARCGEYVMLLRDGEFSHRLYASFSDDGRRWSSAVPTDIPDSPSLSTTVALPNGSVLLVGNMVASDFDNAAEVRHYLRDPLVIAVSSDGSMFERAYALRCGTQQWRTPREEVRGRNGGAQYPSCVVENGILHVQYSMGKEDIWMSSVALACLGPDGGGSLNERGTGVRSQGP